MVRDIRGTRSPFTVDPLCRIVRPRKKRSSDQRGRDVQVVTERSEERITVCPRFERRSQGIRCGAGFSTDVRDAGGSLADSKHNRVQGRMTGQGLVDTVAGDQRTDRHLDTGIDVCVTRQAEA